MNQTDSKWSWRPLKKQLSEIPLRWLTLALSGSLAVALIVLGLPLDWAMNLHGHGGYYFCFILFVCLLYTSWKVLQTVDVAAYARQDWKGLCFVLFASVFVHLFQPHIMRVYNDEPAHQMVAKMMHLERENSVPEAGYALSGDLEYGARTLSYRMYFYPFLVSIVHDLTGFRPINGLLLNGLMGAALFLLVYLGGNRVYSEGGGVLAVALLLSLPLLDEAVTSYGYDVTNLAFLAAFFLALSHYVERRTPEFLNWTVLLGIGLAYSRNESALYLIVIAAVFGVFLFRIPGVTLTRIVAFSPLMLVPAIAARRVFQELMTDLSYYGQETTNNQFFALHYIPENLIRVGQWMFDFSSTVASSPILAFVGLAGLLALLVSSLSKISAKKELREIDWVLTAFAFVVIGSFVFITLAMFWDADSGAAIRFLLPIHLLFVFAGVWFIANTKLPKRNFPLAIGLIGITIFFISIPTKMRDVREENLVFAKYAAWAADWIGQRENSRPLYVSQLNTLFLLHGHPTVDLPTGESEIEKLGQLVAENYYSGVLVFMIEKYNAQTDSWAPARPALPLNPRIITEVVDERRRAYNKRARFLRVTGFLDAEGNIVHFDEFEPMKNDFDNFAEYWDAMRNLHPGLGGY